MVSGGLVGVVGYFQPFLLIGAILATIGAGLLYTLDIGSSSAQYIGFQVLIGVGIGTSIQVPIIAVQALSSLAEIPLVTADVLCRSSILILCYISSFRAVLSCQQFSSLYQARSPSPLRNRCSPTASSRLCRGLRPASTLDWFLSPALLRSGKPLLQQKYLGSCYHT